MRQLAALTVALGALATASSALAIIGGAPDTTHPYVGEVRGSLTAPSEHCSGFLTTNSLGTTLFVTAAHCYAPGSTVYVTFDQDAHAAKTFFTGTVYDDPNFCDICGGNGVSVADSNDIAVVVLQPTANDGSPLPAGPYATLPTVGQFDSLKNASIDVVGYGIQTFVSKGVPGAYGTRQVATTKTAGAGTLGNGFIKILASPGICQGDSGGPNLISGTNIVVAETSFTVGKPSCNGNSYSQRLDTPEALAFINGGYLAAAPRG